MEGGDFNKSDTNPRKTGKSIDLLKKIVNENVIQNTSNERNK